MEPTPDLDVDFRRKLNYLGDQDMLQDGKTVVNVTQYLKETNCNAIGSVVRSFALAVRSRSEGDLAVASKL